MAKKMMTLDVVINLIIAVCYIALSLSGAWLNSGIETVYLRTTFFLCGLSHVALAVAVVIPALLPLHVWVDIGTAIVAVLVIKHIVLKGRHVLLTDPHGR